MKGLILKDLYVLKDSLKIYAFIFLIYGYAAVAHGQAGMMYTMVFLISAVLPVTSISYDERSRWDRIANTMPLSRKDIVVGKYVLAAVLLIVSALFTAIALTFEKSMVIEEKLVTLLVMMLVSMFYQAVMIPLIFKFGSEKGRIILMTICFLPVIILYALSKWQWFRALDIHSFFVNYGRYIPFIAVVAVAAVYIASVAISVSIYTKKDL